MTPPTGGTGDTRTQGRVLAGTPVAPGVAVGPVLCHDDGGVEAPAYRIPAGRVAAEQTRFREAVHAARGQMEKLRARAERHPSAAAEQLGPLLDAHDHMLDDSRLVRGVLDRIEGDRVNAEAALERELAALNEALAACDDPYIVGRVDDVRAVGERIARKLTGTPYRSLANLPRNTIILARELTPADTALLDPRAVKGFATAGGGPESHTAIIARALELPAVVGVAGLVEAGAGATRAVVDGDTGHVILDPDDATMAAYRKRRATFLRQRRRAVQAARRASETRDGVPVALRANVELPVELPRVDRAGAAGIGLLRTEFLFMNRADFPGEAEQYAGLRPIVEAMNGAPVTIRVLDAGGEKGVASVPDMCGNCPNPALGLRGIRLLLEREDLFEPQLAAILRAAAHGPVRILLPMVMTAAEMRRARTILERVAETLRRRGEAVPDPLPSLGAMIEVPAAALAADALAREADFFAIGSNDLTQYALAIDRGDEHVADLYAPTHPAVLRLMQFAAEAAFRAGIPVSVCGEMAGDPLYTPLLVGLGLRELSMAASNLPRVKQRLRALDTATADDVAAAAMDSLAPETIHNLLARHAPTSG